ncbi:MAG: BrnT family toxin [Sideroxyarcus sp.]|nr:BrnT family toxin [Sideroxyarcus sp.]
MPGADIKFELNGDLFVWAAAKAEKNRHKHGIRFEEAATVFGDPMFALVDAARNGEARDAAIGFDITGRLLYVVHIEVEASFIRIISARRAEPEEEKYYVD